MSRRRPEWRARPRGGAPAAASSITTATAILDLFVANYVTFDRERAPRPGDSLYCRYGEIPVPCGPQGFSGGTNLLYRNRGDGTFEDVSENRASRGRAAPRRRVRTRELAAYRFVRHGRRRGRLRQ